MKALCRIELFGGLRVQQHDRAITRFRTQKTGALLAYLAYHLQQPHSREVLIELFWRERAPKVGRTSLRVALSSLRHQLEPPGVPTGAIIKADRFTVQLNPDAVTTDVAEFEAALEAAAHAEISTDQVQHLAHAIELYRGELLLGFYDDWIPPEQRRLEELFFEALYELVSLLEEADDFNRALDYARRGVSTDPLREEAHHQLIRLTAAAGQPDAALQQFRELEQLLKEKLGVAPSAAVRKLARQISEQLAVTSDQLVVVSGGRAVVSSRKAEGRRRKETESGRKGEREKERRGEVVHSPILQFPASIPHPSSLIPLPSSTGNLPLQFTRFFGREQEIAQLRAMLLSDNLQVTQDATRKTQHATRLVTLTGVGGTGKTRLAIETAVRLRHEFAGGVWFVPLSDLADARLILNAVRDALRLPRSPHVEPLEQIVEALSQQPAILVLDNFEHLAAGGAPVVLTLLKRVPSLKVLVTSRRRLGLPGEREFPVRPLPTPSEEYSGIPVFAYSRNDPTTQPPNHLTTQPPEHLMSFPSVQLFLDRTQAVRPDFQMTTRNAPAVAKLCQRLEGIPLAIELAAARAHALSPSQILKRFSERFEILRQRRPKKSDRHRSLWAAMEWSYHLLPTELQRFFARLSVFRGGWSLEAAEAVTGSDGVLECWSDAVPTFQHSITPSLHLLEQLRSHSLVLVEEGVPDVRYRMLETLREFAAEQLTPKERAALARRHAHYFLSLAQKAESQLAGREQQAWLERLEAEHDNLRAAFAWTSKNDAETGLRLAAALGQFWEVHGYWSEGREWLEQCLAQNPDAASDLRVDALVWTGRLMLRRGDYQQSIGVLEDALRLSREMDYRRGIANALHNLGAAATYQSNYARARSFYEDSLRLRGEFADVRGMASLLHSLGFVAIQQNDYARARALCGESLTLHRELGDKRGIALSLNVLAAVTQQQGDYTGERAFLAEGLKTAQEIGDKSTVADFLNGLGAVAFFQGDHAQGRVFFEQSLSLRRALGDPRGIAFSLHGLGWLAQAAGDWAQARALHEEGLAIRRALGERRETIQSLCELGDVTLAQGDVTHALSLYAEALRISQELDIKIGFARGLGAMAKIACLQQQWERAARLFGAADALHKTIGAPLPPPFQRDVDKHLATLRQSLDEATFYACWNAGRDMTPQQAVADALNET